MAQNKIRYLQQQNWKQKKYIDTHKYKKSNIFKKIQKKVNKRQKIQKYSQKIKKNSLKKQIWRYKQDSIRAISKILEYHSNNEKIDIMQNIINGDQLYEDYFMNVYTKKLIKQHNKEILKYDTDNNKALRNYYTQVATGTTKLQYQAIHLTKKYENIFKDRKRQKTTKNLYVNTSTTYNRNVEARKKELKDKKEQQTDILCGIVYMDGDRIIQNEYESWEEAKKQEQHLHKLENTPKEIIHVEFRRNPLKTILLETPNLCVINSETYVIEPNICVDGSGVKGDPRGKNMFEGALRLPVYNAYTHSEDGMLFLSRFYCQEKSPLLKKIFYLWYGALIEQMENKQIKLEGYGDRTFMYKGKYLSLFVLNCLYLF